MTLMENLEQAFVDYASSRTNKARDARLSKFEADFKQQQSEMTNKINTLLKAINDRMTDALPSDMVKNLNVEVYVLKLKLLEDFYIIDIEKDPTCPLLVEKGFLATASAVIDCKKSKIAAGEGITSCPTPYYLEKDFKDNYVPEEWEIARDAELNPFRDVLVFRKIMEFLGAIPINFKGN
ncbi:hypothetical protein Tco_0880489, partial [Tanacetum coccineum]